MILVAIKVIFWSDQDGCSCRYTRMLFVINIFGLSRPYTNDFLGLLDYDTGLKV